MQCPATGYKSIDRVDSLGRPRAELTPSSFGSSLPIQTNSIPRRSRDFYFPCREIEPASRFTRAGITLLSRSHP